MWRAFGAISTQGLVAIKIVRGSVDGDTLYNFVCTSLRTKLIPFNGTNQNSVHILVSCSMDHVDEVDQPLSDCGVITHYLPPYSPDYNPIELAFSKVKTSLNQWKQRCKQQMIWRQLSWLHLLP